MEARRNLLPRLLAGLQVGMMGGLGIIVWLAVLSTWNLKAPWALVNLFAATIGNRFVWEHAFSFFTLTGLAAHLFLCSLLGIFVGYIVPLPEDSTSQVSLTALVFGVLISLMTYEFYWRRMVPVINDYVTPASFIVAHMIFGLSMAQFPRYFWRLIEEPEAEPLDEDLPEPPLPEQ
jgi:hypothetical protein